MKILLPSAAVLALSLLARPALATPACSSLPGRVVTIESGDTQENLLKVLGRQLRDDAGVVLAFILTGSCTITSDMYTQQPILGGTLLEYVPSTAEVPGWDPTQPELQRTADPNGNAIDVGIAALFVQSCGLGGPPAGSNLTLVNGPIQAYTFVAPSGSSQQAIWAEEAYYAFGFGDQNQLAPWNDQELMFIRPPSKSTLVATAANILVPPDKWHGIPEDASEQVVSAVATSPDVERTVGILGSEVYDADRGAGIKTLAFQAFGQEHAYFPDSGASAFDKRNVRDGHYTLWSPTVYITPTDASGNPVNPDVAYLEDLVLGVEGAPSPEGGVPVDGLGDVVQVGLTPECAMHVTRSADGGPLSLFSSPTPCDCFFASRIPGAAGGAPAGCTACTTDTTCGGGQCRHGFCEAH
ncbi:MAG TPA: hypothetical protein VGG39_02485 [Polyangiaceae bacterium]|jgi:hypothetical protein